MAKKKRAQFFKPPNVLKAKVGSGGLPPETLHKAQKVFDAHTQDFEPLGEIYLQALLNGIQDAEIGFSDDSNETIIARILYPAIQIKANAGMFQFPLIAQMAAKMIVFLERSKNINADMLEVCFAFYTAMNGALITKKRGQTGKAGQALLKELSDACARYFDKHQDAA